MAAAVIPPPDSRIRRRGEMAAGLALVALLVVPLTAHAQSSAELLGQASAAYHKGQYQNARRALELVQMQASDPDLLCRTFLYLGLIEAAEGSEDSAIKALTQALKYNADLTLDPAKFSPTAMRLFQKVKRGLSGTPAPPTPPPLPPKRSRPPPLPPKGARPPPLPPKPAAADKAPEAEPSAAAIVTPAWVDPEPEAEQEISHRRFFTWIVAGTAAAALGAGIGLGVSANLEFDDWEASCRESRNNACNDAARSVESKDVAANIMFGMAGTLAVTSVVLFFLENRLMNRLHKKTGATLTPVAGRASGGALKITF